MSRRSAPKEQVLRAEDAHVRREHVARRQRHDVAHDDFFQRDFLLLALARHADCRVNHLGELRRDTVGSLTECGNLVFMGSTVVSGSATAVVLAVGHDTMLGAMAKALNVKPPKTTFEKGVNSVSWVLIRFMLLMVPIVLLINGLSDGDWIQAGLFAISIAVGLTPEMLPMIVTPRWRRAP